MKIGSSRQKRKLAFTLVALVVVIFLVLLLAGTFFSALQNARSRAGQMQCLNNLKQVGVGVLQYLPDNEDIFSACGSRNTYGFQPEDWIYWRTNKSFPQIEKSPTAKYITSFHTNLLRCSRDIDFRERRQRQSDSHGLYIYSYSMLSYPDVGTNAGGISSVFGGGFPRYFKQQAIRNPAHKLMLIEEQASHRRGESPDVGGSSEIINDGRWIPDGDMITVRHNGRGQSTFADGHVEMVRPHVAKLRVFTDPTY